MYLDTYLPEYFEVNKYFSTLSAYCTENPLCAWPLQNSSTVGHCENETVEQPWRTHGCPLRWHPGSACGPLGFRSEPKIESPSHAQIADLRTSSLLTFTLHFELFVLLWAYIISLLSTYFFAHLGSLSASGP